MSANHLGETCIFRPIHYGEMLWAMTFETGENLMAKVHDGRLVLATARPDSDRKGKNGTVWYRVDALPYGTVTTAATTWHSDPQRAYAKMIREGLRTFEVAFDIMERKRMASGSRSTMRGRDGRFPFQPTC